MDQRAAERTYGILDEVLTEPIGWSLPALRKTWNQSKPGMAPWWPEVSKEAFNTGLDALARGLKNWNDSRRGARSGDTAELCQCRSSSGQEQTCAGGGR